MQTRSANRVVPLAEAARMVKTGHTLGLGGMTLYRRPIAFVRELLRCEDHPTDLTLLCFTAGMESDLLVGAGMVAQTRTCYFGLEIFGLAPMFTQAANSGNITIVEETEASLAMGMRAAMSGVGFMPAFAWRGTDLMTLRPDIKTVVDPYSGETLTAFPALSCDVAVIHALQADQRGNAILNDNLAVDQELAMVADIVIITAEDIVDKIEGKVHIPAQLTTAVSYAPKGAWPTSCYPLYPIGGGEILKYIDACNGEDFKRYVTAMLAADWGR
jgi:glutaconate CoA-transferase subunit A